MNMADFIPHEKKKFTFLIPDHVPDGPIDFSSPTFCFCGIFFGIKFKAQKRQVKKHCSGLGPVNSNTVCFDRDVSIWFSRRGHPRQFLVGPSELTSQQVTCEARVIEDKLYLCILVKVGLYEMDGTLNFELPYAAKKYVAKVVECEVKWKTSDESNAQHYQRYISNQFLLALKGQLYCDVVLTVKGHDVRAHKLILAAHSPVFRAMFNSDMQEMSGKVSIKEGLELEGIKGMIEFMYSPIQEIFQFESDRAAIEIYKCSHKYEVCFLTQNCSDFLCSVMDESNALDILHLASVYSDAPLKEAALKFVVEHPNSVDDDVKCQLVIKESPELFKFLLQRCKLK